VRHLHAERMELATHRDELILKERQKEEAAKAAAPEALIEGPAAAE